MCTLQNQESRKFGVRQRYFHSLRGGLMEGSWKIAVLQVVLVGIQSIAWYPFFRKADQGAYELEQTGNWIQLSNKFLLRH